MFDLIIVGGGVAGMTAALYALRNGKSVLLLEKECIGGQIAKSPKVENYPAIKSISGSELSDNLFEQISDLGANFELENVLKIEKVNNIFKVQTDYNSYEAKAIILATGAKHKRLNLENEDKFIGKGIYYCAICDGPFFAGKEVSIIGNSSAALQYALMLSAYCLKVNLITRSNKLSGEEKVIQQVKNMPNINILNGYTPKKFIGNDALEKVVFIKENGEDFILNTNAVFVAIGQQPDNKSFENIAKLDDKGYLIANESCNLQTDGLFVAGDCRTKEVRQVATAISDGAIAAIKACKYIKSLGE